MATRYAWARYNKPTDSQIFSSSGGSGGQGGTSVSNLSDISVTACSAYTLSITNGVVSVTASGSKKTISRGTATISATAYPYIVTSEYIVKALEGTNWSSSYDSDVFGFSISINGAMYYRRIDSISSIKGSFAGRVFASSSTAYPDQSTSGYYYYEYEGSDDISPAAISYPSSIKAGENVSVTVTPSSSLQYGSPTYVYEYSTDGGSSWSAVQSTNTASVSFDVPNTATQIRFRVKATSGDVSSGYVTGNNVTLTEGGGGETGNVPPSAPPSIAVENTAVGSRPSVAWAEAADSDGTVARYTLQRSVNGSSFVDVYNGNSTSFVDQEIPSTWTSVQYRIRAIDNKSAASPWKLSEIISISGGGSGGDHPSASGRLEQFSNSTGTNIYPQTVVEGVFRQSDGKTLVDILAAIEKSTPEIELPLSIENGGTGASDAPTALSALIDGGNPTFPSAYYTDMYIPISVNGLCYKVPFTSIQKWTVGDRGSSASQANTSYSSFIARGIAAGTTDYTAGSTSMTSGTIYLVYE